MVLKITNLHILRYLPTCWLYLLERYTIDNQRCTHTASVSKNSEIEVVKTSTPNLNKDIGEEILKSPHLYPY